MPLPTTNYVQLRQALLSRDPNAFSFLYDTYAAALYGDILRVMTDQEEASEVLVRTFVWIKDHIGSYNPEHLQLFAWMLQAARRQVKLSLELPKGFNKHSRSIYISSDNALAGSGLFFYDQEANAQ